MTDILAELSSHLKSLLLENDAQRKNAENAIDQACTNNPSDFMASLLRLMRESPEGEIKKMALIIFKGRLRKYFHNPENDVVWKNMAPEVRQQAKETPIWIILNDPSEECRRAAVPLLTDLAAKQNNSGEWPTAHEDILRMYVEQINNPGAVCFLQVAGEMVISDPDILNKPGVGVKHAEVCKIAFSQGDMESRCQGIMFLGSTVCGVPDRSHWEPLVQFGQILIESLQQLSNGNVLENGQWIPNEAEAISNCLEIVGSFVEIAEEASSFYKPFLNELLETVFSIVNNPQIDEDLRQFCAEMIMCILADKPKMCQSVPNFNDTLLKTSIELMLTVDEDQAIDDDAEYLYSVGERGVDAITKAVGSAEIFPKLFGYVKELIASQVWQQRFAGIICICQTTEYINKADQLKTLQDMVPVVLTAIRDDHEMVRLAAARCIGQMAYDLSPVFQVHFTNEILDALVERFEDKQVAVINKSLRAFVNFCDELTGADIAPCMQKLLDSFVKCLAMPISADSGSVSNIISMKENAITSISVTAAVSGKRFTPYYGTIAKEVINFVTAPVEFGNSMEMDTRPIRAQAVDCISHIGAAVGPEVFGVDGVEVMSKLLEIKNDASVQDDDPIHEKFFDAFKKMVVALGPHFKQFVEPMMSQFCQLLSTREEKIDPFEVSNPFDFTFYEGEDGDGFTAVKSSILLEMTKCLSLIETVAKTGDIIDGCLPMVISAVQPLIEFQGTKVAIAEVTACLAALLERMLISNPNELPALIEIIIKDCFEHIKEEHINDLESYAVYLAEVTDGLAKCIQACGQAPISQEAHNFVIQRAFAILKKSIEARQITLSKLSDNNLDEEDREKIESNAQIEQTFRNGLISLAGALMANDANKYMANGAQYTRDFITTAFASPNPDDKVLGIYLCDDILNHLGDMGVSLWPLFIDEVINCCKHEKHHIRQAAAYGIIWAAKRPDFTSEMVNTVIQNLASGLGYQVLNKTVEEDEEIMLATDNIVAALHAIIVNKHACIDANTLQEVSHACYQQLPLKADYSENLVVMKSLVDEILNQNQVVLGANNRNLPLIVSGFAQIYKTMMSSDKLDNEICECLRKIGEDKLKEILPQISQVSQKYVERLWKDIFTSM